MKVLNTSGVEFFFDQGIALLLTSSLHQRELLLPKLSGEEKDSLLIMKTACMYLSLHILLLDSNMILSLISNFKTA